MARLAGGDVAVVTFPFFDNPTVAKARPALVLAVLPGDDVILCAITSHPPRANDLPLIAADFQQGGLPRASTIRPTHLFTMSSRYIKTTVGHVAPVKLDEVLAALIRVLS